MPSKRKVDGSWRDVSRRYVKVNGQWRAVKEKYVKVNGVWKLAGSFFHVEPYIISPGNWAGSYSMGVMPDGKFGADINGGLGNSGQTVYIGIRITGIPQWAPVSYNLDLSGSDLANTTLYARDEFGNAWNTFNQPSEYMSVTLSYWSGTEMILAFMPSGNHVRTASFRISNIHINGVKK